MQHGDQLVKCDAAVPSRRSFLKGSGLLAGGVVTSGTLGALAAHTAWAQGGHHDKDKDDRARRGRRSHYGELHPTPDVNEGKYVLALPRGFQYCVFSKTGDKLSDSYIVPRNHDGMACFDGRGHLVRLIRNHEVRNAPGAFDPALFSLSGPEATRFDPKGNGGTVTLDFDTESKKLVRHFISLNGTIVNCSGGLAWRNAGWITCEERNFAGPQQGWGTNHGYNFFVPVWADRPTPAIPLTWMGRFSHEAAVADQRGFVYQTEDNGSTSGFYRSIPNHRGDLSRGGTLEMLAIRGTWQADLINGQTVGARLPVEWVDIGSPDPDLENGAKRCFLQGRDKGGAAFNRLEGIFMSQDGRSVYFVSTSGGDKGYGQLWHYIPADDKFNDDDQLVLVFESPKGSILDSPDNMCVTPSGGILFCEDDANALGVDDNDTHPLAPGIVNVNRLIGLGVAGEPFEFAVNILNDSEFAGACFSPDGEILFVNVFGDGNAGSGMTCAIWGPWERGPL